VSLIRNMPLRKKILLVNACGIAGIVLSTIGLPGDTPFWIWAACSLVALGLLNCMVLWQRSPQPDDQRPKKASNTLAIYGFALLLIIDVIWGYLKQR